jgi:hypothetical protein
MATIVDPADAFYDGGVRNSTQGSIYPPITGDQKFEQRLI